MAVQGVDQWSCNGSTNVYTITMNENASSPTFVIDSALATSVSGTGKFVTATGTTYPPVSSVSITLGGTTYTDKANN
jgi:hypothetical protein